MGLANPDADDRKPRVSAGASGSVMTDWAFVAPIAISTSTGLDVVSVCGWSFLQTTVGQLRRCGPPKDASSARKPTRLIARSAASQTSAYRKRPVDRSKWEALRAKEREFAESEATRFSRRV